ncbi:ankyrin repeat-containing domain protein [Podospora fimiseda]|uniref:Ankyrin repeat-containing domain protein n=1 Tax=Podospora fimiseda TaxID=252190 RepID=A0AAN7GUA4_9PEZI|nr:ankyrin repeat-containing domain protein [Podospora fimiseda]
MATEAEPPSLSWHQHEDEILDLFISQNQSLRNVARHMSQRHGFNASERQYKDRYNGMKNIKSEEWRYIAEELDRRSVLGEQCSVYLHGRKLPWSRVYQSIARVRGTKHRVTKPSSIESKRRNPWSGRIYIGSSPPVIHNSASRQDTPSRMFVEPFIETHDKDCFDESADLNGPVLQDYTDLRLLPVTSTHQELAPGDLVKVAARGQPALQNFITNQPERVSIHKLEQALESAIQTGHVDSMLALLNHGVDPNAPSLSTPPLKTAMLSKSPRVLELLLSYKGITAFSGILSGLWNVPVMDWYRPGLLKRILELGPDTREREEGLREAAGYGDIVSAELLIQSGVDIDAPGESLAPLQRAAWNGEDDMVLFLLDRKANINTPAYGKSGVTALQAALSGDTPLRTGRLLLQHGADAAAPPVPVDGRTALEAYCTNNLSIEPLDPQFCFELLEAGATVNRPGTKPSLVIHGVIDQGWTDVLAHFLRPEHNAVVNHFWSDSRARTLGDDDESLTPTQRAAHHGNLDALTLLLDHGTDINEAPAHELGRTALQAASVLKPGAQKMEIIEFLLERGADIHAKPALVSGFTALQGAAISGDIKLAELFLSKGEDVNESPSFKEGRYAIEGAAENGRLHMVRLLLNSGAKGNVMRGTGLTNAIRLAEEKGHFVVANMLKAQEKRWQ